MSHAELRLQIAVVQFLRHALPPEVLHWHTPNGGVRDAREAAKLKAMGTTPGVPDLLFLLPGGRLGCIELKADRGRVTCSQTEWMRKASLAGAYVAVCRSIDEVADTLQAWLQPLGVALRARVAA